MLIFLSFQKFMLSCSFKLENIKYISLNKIFLPSLHSISIKLFIFNGFSNKMCNISTRKLKFVVRVFQKAKFYKTLWKHDEKCDKSWINRAKYVQIEFCCLRRKTTDFREIAANEDKEHKKKLGLCM